MPPKTDTREGNAGVPPAVAGASRPRFGAVTIRDRGRLPHWEFESGTYFVTFRLADSLPKVVAEQLATERDLLLRRRNDPVRPITTLEAKRLQSILSSKLEKYLDAGIGDCRLKDFRGAETVANAIRFHDGKRYRLFAWCVMPNHVHVAFKILPANELAEILHSWKSFTAKQINRITNQSGIVWAREYYDHLVRNQEELGRVIRYIERNPEKAGLKDWPWCWVCGQDAHTTAGGTPAVR